MDQREASRAIDDVAAQWAARVDLGAMTAEDERTLEAWLSRDPRHLGAYAKARAVATRMEKARALGLQFDPKRFAAPDVPQPLRRRAVLLGGVAAAAAACVAVAVGISPRQTVRTAASTDPQIAMPAKAPVDDVRRFSTRLGETRIVPLQDGSVITLNTASTVAVRYTDARRGIELVSGEALFDVAKDQARPFVVSAHGMEVRAVGTSFTVQALPARPVSVLVREGIVEVHRPAVLNLAPVRVAANNRLIAPLDAPIVAKPIPPKEVDRELVWRVGRLSFEGETLQAAAEMFARYSETRIIIDDPTLAGERIAGLFVSNDPVGFAKAAAISLNARAEIGDGVVRLSR